MTVFFSASANDSDSRVTVNVKDFDLKHPVKKGDWFVITLVSNSKPYNILFSCNRDNETLKTTSWPCDLPKLQPGVTFEVDTVLARADVFLQKDPQKPNTYTFYPKKYTGYVAATHAKAEKIVSGDFFVVHWPEQEPVLQRVTQKMLDNAQDRGDFILIPVKAEPELL